MALLKAIKLEPKLKHLVKLEDVVAKVKVEVEDHEVRQWMRVEQVETVVRAEVIFRFATAATVLDTKQMFAPTIGARNQMWRATSRALRVFAR